jgi:chromosomal replication initiator protein
MPRPALTFARIVATPENRAACLAVQEVASGAGTAPTVLTLHGPAGTGKSHLVHALAAQRTHDRPDLVVALLAAADLTQAGQPTLFDNEDGIAPTAALEAARHCDLLIVEDLQHLNPRAAEALVQVMDHLRARGRPMVFTANAGPQRLTFRGQRMPARLTSRLAGGLVVGLEPLGPVSRLKLLQTFAQRRQLAVPTEVLRWLADQLTGGGRQLEGAIARLETLARVRRGPLDLASVADEFREQTEAGRITMDRIAERVGGYFRVDPSDLQSRRRSRGVLLPRQVGMFLARQLTELSLGQIGAYFGGRDHTTVLHACRKVEEALEHDAGLSGAVRELRAELV